jgi:2-polyprenyl-6-hydroxyphenyl methylase/3-demethylubiquinone-9 3-methyltransferase
MKSCRSISQRVVSRKGKQLHSKLSRKTNSASFVTVLDPLNYYHQQKRCLSSSSSFSPSEVAKFSELSKIWWDPKENPLIGMNSIRIQHILDCVELKDKRALDVGCGGGLLSESLARLGANVTAIDPSKELVEQAKRHSQLDPRTRTINYRGGHTVEELAAEEKEKFDVICCLEVIEHVTDIHSLLNAMSSLLKPNGKLFLSTINRTAKSHAAAIVGAEYIMRYLPVGTHDWDTFKSPQEVSTIVKECGLEQVHVTGMVLTSPPFQGRWNWKLDEQDTDVNWIGTYQLLSSDKDNDVL